MEIALYPSERTEPSVSDGRIYRKLRGSILVAIPQQTIRRKWVELCGQSLCPDKRAGFTGVSVYTTLTKAWKRAWRDAALAMFHDDITVDQAWAAIAGDAFPQLGTDPNGDVPLTDTWLWSEWERKNFLLGRIDSEDPLLATKIRYKYGGGEAMGPAYTIDYRNSLGLPEAAIGIIENANEVVDPDLSVVWPAELAVLVCKLDDIIVPTEVVG